MHVGKGLKERERKLTKMMAIIYMCFVTLYVPGWIVKQVCFKEYITRLKKMFLTQTTMKQVLENSFLTK